jgi:predicted DNA-binding protein with PD1-like motif
LSSEPTDDGLWRVASNGYWYELTTRDGAEVIAYHWHPSQDQHVRFPHLHITGGAPSAVVTRRSHVPTGHVPLAAVVRFALAELGVRPQRPDWERVLGVAD